MVIDRSKSQQEIGTRIGRLSDEPRKNESSEDSHELEREGYRNYGELEEMLQGDEYLDRRPIPKVAGVDEKEKMNDP